MFLPVKSLRYRKLPSLGWFITLCDSIRSVFSHSVHTYRTNECEHMTAGIARRHPSSRICKEEAPLPAEHFERCGVAFQIRKVLGEDLGGDVRYEALVPLSEGPRVVYNKNLPRT
jgi:hypothetical protein